LRIIPTTVRVVCWNTLTLAVGSAKCDEGLKIYHSESLKGKVESARAKLGLVTKRLEGFQEQGRGLARKSMSSAELTAYFTKLVEGRSQKQQSKILEALLTNFDNCRNTLTGMKGSAWAAYNAVSEYADHSMVVHGHGIDRLDARVNSQWFGAGNSLKQKAFELALSMAA
jgi:hypothetical protein